MPRIFLSNLKCPHCKKELPNRSDQQNKALHKWFELVADELNASGQSKQKVLGKTIELNWDARSVKEDLWRPVQKALLKKHSTTELLKLEDIDKVYEHLNRFLGEKCEIHVPFPTQAEIDGKIIGKNYTL